MPHVSHPLPVPPHAPDGLRQVAAAEWMLNAVEAHQSPRTHTSLGQPPSTLTGRLPSVLNTLVQGVRQAMQQPFAMMAPRMSPSMRSSTTANAFDSPLVGPSFQQMDCFLKLGDIPPVRGSLNIMFSETEHFIALDGILNFHLTFRGVGVSNDLCRHHQVQFDLS